jgi:membrane protein implicated in regulation of membrane protease activity
MAAIYTFCAVVGGVLTLLALFSWGNDAGMGDGFEGEVDGEGLGNMLSSLFSVRALMLLLAFFGLTGLVLGAVWSSPVGVALVAGAIGLFAAFFHARFFQWLKRTSSGEIRAGHLEGAVGRVVVPLVAGGRGRIRVEVGGQSTLMTAVPFRTSEETQFGLGDEVVVVEMDGATARIAPLDEMGSWEVSG